MRATSTILVLLGSVLGYLGAAAGAEGQRVLLLDIGRRPNGNPGSDQHRLILLDIETGKALASAALGNSTNLALSPTRGTIAAVSHVRGTGTRLEFFHAADLAPLKSGRFSDSIPRGRYMIGAAVDSAVSPDGQELLIGGLDPEGRGNVDLLTTVLTRVKCQLDEEGFFAKTPELVQIPFCRSVDFVNVAGWPKIHVLNPTLTVLETVNLDSGKVLSRLPLGDKPGLDKLDPAKLDPAKLAELDLKQIIRSHRNQGVIVSTGGRFAYYIPRPVSHAPGAERQLLEPGRLKKIDLSANPPCVEAKGDPPQGYLRANVACVADVAGSLFVLEHTRNANSTHEPSRRLLVFRTSDLKFERFIELPLNDCDAVEASGDGKFLCALDAEQAKLAVVDLAPSAAAPRVLDLPARYPRFMIGIP